MDINFSSNFYFNLFQLIVFFTIAQRLFELRLAKKNEQVLIKMGARIIQEKNYFFMVLLHVSWLASMVWVIINKNQFMNHSLHLNLFYFFLFTYFLGQTLRIVAIKTLGVRWSTRIVILPHTNAIRNGLFKWIRHPNYLGVCLEIVSLPMMMGLWEMAIFFSLVNLVILVIRIKLEEKKLIESNFYQQIFNLKNAKKI